MKLSTARWRAENPDKVAAQVASYAASGRSIEQRRAYRSRNRAKQNEYHREYYARNKEKHRDAHRRWREANPDKFKASKQAHYQRSYAAHPEKHKARVRASVKKRLGADPAFKMQCAVQGRIGRVLKTRGRSRTFKMLGYTSDELAYHIASTFKPGMSWENFGFGEGRWHIEHIRPIASYSPKDFPSIEEFIIEAFKLTNLEASWHSDNLRKSSIWAGMRWAKGRPIACVVSPVST
ncbi:hypothetical protein [Methylobacterium sp. CCH5-D2]|uniref:hypothetical protein n=1 Tax=Methylobacterium sp. CCH5-D2 TaxID=1768765 RepID=UPI0012E3DB22|nr:hypothetical protein [Methylobacterium sp. CCH5-D2]